MSIKKHQSSIVEKMAGKQCRLLLFFVVPILILIIWAMLYGFLGSYREEAESKIVQLENGKILIDDLKENDRVNYRIVSKKDKIEIFDNVESVHPLFGVVKLLCTKKQEGRVEIFTVDRYPLLYNGVECQVEAYINITGHMRGIFSIVVIVMLIYLAAVGLFYRYSTRQLRELLKPMKKMAATLNRMTVNNLHSERLDILGVSEEIRDLSIVCNEMLDRIEGAYESQKQFVSNASHELRTPIAVVQGYANMLERWGASDPEILEEAVTAMCKVSKEMQDLVEKLLFLSRHDRKTLKLKREVFDMKDVVDEVFRETEMVVENRILSCETKDAAVVYGDKQVMKQAIRIFIDNAVKYTEAGDTIKIACRTVRNECEVIVEDSGIGMRKKDLNRIFSRFYRSDDVRGRNIAGHGLGLSIAKLIIVSHSGRIHIRTQFQKGTAFSFYLPLHMEM